MPGNLVERAAQGAFAPLLAVVGDGEAVGFVAHTLQQIHAFGLAFEDDRIVVVRHPHLFQAFGQSADGHVVHATVLKRLGGGHDLRLAAIDHHQVRLVGKVMPVCVLLDDVGRGLPRIVLHSDRHRVPPCH